MLSQPAAKNVAPATKWFATTLACGIKRQRLFLDGRETPFFIDSAMGRLAHRTEGCEHGLWGAGMETGCRTGRPIAACLGSGGQISILKHRAEQMAFEAAA